MPYELQNEEFFKEIKKRKDEGKPMFVHDVPEDVKAKFKAAVALTKPRTSMRAVLVNFMKSFTAGKK